MPADKNLMVEFEKDFMSIYGILLTKVFNLYSYLPSFYKVEKNRHKQDSIREEFDRFKEQIYNR